MKPPKIDSGKVTTSTDNSVWHTYQFILEPAGLLLFECKAPDNAPPQYFIDWTELGNEKSPQVLHIKGQPSATIPPGSRVAILVS